MMRVRHSCLVRIRERPEAASKAGPGCMCRAPSPCRRSGTLRASIASLCTGYIGGTPVESRCQVRIVCMLMTRHLMRSRPRIVHTQSMHHRGSISRQCMVYTALLAPASCRCTAQKAFRRERRRTYSCRTSGIMYMCYLCKYSMSLSVQICGCVVVHAYVFIHMPLCLFRCFAEMNTFKLTLPLALSLCTCIDHAQACSIFMHVHQSRSGVLYLYARASITLRRALSLCTDACLMRADNETPLLTYFPSYMYACTHFHILSISPKTGLSHILPHTAFLAPRTQQVVASNSVAVSAYIMV
jgi:hypothetical protein